MNPMRHDLARFSAICVSSLVKVFTDGRPAFEPLTAGSALNNEVYSFQVAYYCPTLIKPLRVRCTTAAVGAAAAGTDVEAATVDSATVDSAAVDSAAVDSAAVDSAAAGRLQPALDAAVELRAVGLAPSELPWRDSHDDDALRTQPGLFPDPLLPISDGLVLGLPQQWRAVWVTLDLAAVPGAAGDYRLSFSFEADAGGVGAAALTEPVIATFTLSVVPVALPAQTLKVTHWFHSDCLATYYRCAVFSERHWQIIARFMRAAARRGSTLLLTPLFTPPLDTSVGGERPTVQLIDVVVVDAPGTDSPPADGSPAAAGTAAGVPAIADRRYRFGFDRLARWIDTALAAGITHFEMAHLFTQWGAEFCPKIIAAVADAPASARSAAADTHTPAADTVPVPRAVADTTDVPAGYTTIFGWHTRSDSPAYQQFLAAFLPQLVDFLRTKGVADRCYFHISDEPRVDHLRHYQRVAEPVKRLLQGFPIMDALSNYEFYQQGVVQLPVPAVDHIQPFIDNHVEPLWTYYCVSQRRLVTNRFFQMPSPRNRIFGVQAYLYNLAGFLHWGFNFWYAQYSTKPIDPWQTTDADRAFPSGDAFLVYPGDDGVPVESLRLVVFHEALQDLRALQLLEQRLGRPAVTALIAEGLSEPISFTNYPRDEQWLPALRRRVNAAIAASATGGAP